MSNFYIENYKIKNKRVLINNITSASEIYGFKIHKYKNIGRSDKILRNLVNPEIGKYMLNQAMNIDTSQQMTLFNEG